jgi:hypothetical protein
MINLKTIHKEIDTSIDSLQSYVQPLRQENILKPEEITSLFSVLGTHSNP